MVKCRLINESVWLRNCYHIKFTPARAIRPWGLLTQILLSLQVHATTGLSLKSGRATEFVKALETTSTTEVRQIHPFWESLSRTSLTELSRVEAAVIDHVYRRCGSFQSYFSEDFYAELISSHQHIANMPQIIRCWKVPGYVQLSKSVDHNFVIGLRASPPSNFCSAALSYERNACEFLDRL